MITSEITIDPILGTDIEDAFKDATRIATILNVGVSFKFNGVSCFAKPYGNFKDGADRYRQISAGDKSIKLAIA
jgi:hypothetical protein